MQIKKLPGVGVEFSNLDLRYLIDEEMTAIRNAFAEEGVVFFRDQDIDEHDHIDFAERWGPININRFFKPHPDLPQIALVEKEPEHKDNIGGSWHTDHSYDVDPALGSILVARILPESGGDTWFASMYKAYETLDEATKQEIEGLSAIHSARRSFGSARASYYSRSEAGGDRIGNAAAADVMDDVVHPVVIRHPLSGKKALFVNPGFTTEIRGYTEARSKELLSHLFAHAMKREHCHRFQWKPGSVAFWDNRSTWHMAVNDYQGQRRIMHRITIEGCQLDAA